MHVWRHPRNPALLHGTQPGSDGAVSRFTTRNRLGRAPVDAQAIHSHVLDHLHALSHQLCRELSKKILAQSVSSFDWHIM